MDPDENNIGLRSQCSCEDCDTLRCLTRKNGTFTDNDERLSNTCIFFTEVNNFVKKASSDTGIAKSAQETVCEICRRCFKNERNLDTVSPSACTLINLLNKKIPVCESCMRKINKIKQQTNNADLVIIDAKPKENGSREIKFEICGKISPAEQRPMRKSKCKICIRDFDTHDNVGDIKIDTCKKYFPPNIDTAKSESKICKKDTETLEFVDKPQKNYLNKSHCKFCNRYVDSQGKEKNDLICNICKAYIPASMNTNAGIKSVRSCILEFCQNYLQTNINKTAMQLLDTVKAKCKRCKNDLENAVEVKRCKFCKRHVGLPEEIKDSVCKICKAYFPSNLYTGNKIAKSSLFELCPNYQQKKSNKTSTNILGSVKRKCKRCKKYIERDTEQKRCIYCRRYVDSCQEKLGPICKICKPYFPSNLFTDTVKNKYLLRKQIETKPVNSKVFKQYIETKDKIVRTTDSNGEMRIIISNISLCQDCRINNVCNELKQRKDTPILTSTDTKCADESKCKVCPMVYEELQAAIHKAIGVGKDMKKYNLNATPCKDCRMDCVSTESLGTDETCSGKLKCQVCKKYVNEWEVAMAKNAATYKKIIPLCDFCRRNLEIKGSSDNVIISNIIPDKTCSEKFKCTGCIRDIEEWETATELSVVHSERSSDTINKVTSLCQVCRKYNKTKANTENICTKKSKCTFCRKDVKDWQVHFGMITPDKKINNKSSHSQLCGMNIDNFDNEITPTKHNYALKGCNKDIKMLNHIDTVNNDVTLINKSGRPSSVKKIEACNCKKVIKSDTKVCNISQLRKDINPSALKLSAQIMNVPYEEFKESLNQQINGVNKATMKSTLSNDIFKRIKEAYNACSCKVCECITGKSLTESNVCNCKPCDCADCKSFKHLSHEIKSEPKLGYLNKVFCKEVKQIQSQPCGCTPCSCIRCNLIPTEDTVTAKSNSLPLARTYIAARVSESRHADNCTCPACHCIECERNFFSLSSHVTHEMSTGMSRSCRCEQCMDQRCRGAGGTDDCRCEMPNKAIFKPVEKDSHDYDIRRAAVCHLRNNKKNACCDAIAMYATVSSSYLRQGKIEEGCSCKECECISCKDENSKISVRTILKLQPQSQMQSNKTNTCTCKACECENCTNARNISDSHLINDKDAVCDCDKCDCMSCQTLSKYMTSRMEALAKPIDKLNKKECTDCNIPITGCSQTKCEENRHNVCMKTKANKACCNNKNFNNTQNIKDRYCFLDSKNSTLGKICSVSQDLAKKQSSQYTAIYKDCNKNLNKAANHIHYGNKCHGIKCGTHCQSATNKNNVEYSGSSVSTFSGLNHVSFNENYEYENKRNNSPPWHLTMSNYKADSSKTTLETCLNDILTLDDDLSLKVGSKMIKPNISYNTTTYDYEKSQDIDDIDVYDYMFEPFSKFHRNFYNKNFDGVKIYDSAQNDTCTKYKIKNQNKMCTIPPIVNRKNNFVKHDIDYARVQNTLKEAKDFSEQLIKLLDKYERANRDFHSVSEKLKLLHESNDSKKDNVHFQLDYVIIDQQNNIHDNNKLVNTTEDGKHYATDVNRSSIIKDNKKILTSTEAQIVNIDEKTFESSLITANNNPIPEVKTLIVPIEDEIAVKSARVDNKGAKIDEEPNNNKKNEEETFVKDTKWRLLCEKNTHNQIDILTDRLSEIIKGNVLKYYKDTVSSHVPKHDTTIEISNNSGFLSEENDEGSENGSINRTNFHLKNLDFDIPPYGLILIKDDAKPNTYSMSVQTPKAKYKIDKITNLKSGSSLPRNKTTKVDKESDTRSDLMGKNLYKGHHQKFSRSTLFSGTESDLDAQSRFTLLSSNGHSAMGKAKCSCEMLKVGFLGGRRVSDHTVMVKWTKPKDLKNVQGYELLVDGRPVQTIIDSSRCMAVVTCLPNSDKVLLTMKTILLVATKSGHEPSVTIVYHPRLKKIKNKIEQTK